MAKRIFYLVSGSAARRQLLKEIGLSFKVIVPNIKERQRLAKKENVRDLALANAMKKAEYAGRRIKRGIIISADTLVTDERGRIINKPANLAEAKRILQLLMSRPHWVYTGLVVWDRDKDILVKDCQRTKIYMDKMDSSQVQRYFKSVSPFNKAGGFDIQGKGGLFIRRIEGCFYNVVGLPLRSLYRLLRRLKVDILILVVCLGLVGCATEYNVVTGKEELYYYSTDKEVNIGRSIVQAVEKEYKLCDDPLVVKRVRDIGKRLVEVCDRKDIDYSFNVLEIDEINAFALPGGFIYVNKGLIDYVKDDDELACVLAHEIGHVVARHSIKKLQGLQMYSLLGVLLKVSAPYEVSAAADAAFTQILAGYSRGDELLADRLGVRYAKLAGYNPRAMMEFLQRLDERERYRSLRPRSYLKTHPYTPDRIRVVKEEMGEKLGFVDYINKEEDER